MTEAQARHDWSSETIRGLVELKAPSLTGKLIVRHVARAPYIFEVYKLAHVIAVTTSLKFSDSKFKQYLAEITRACVDVDAGRITNTRVSEAL